MKQFTAQQKEIVARKLGYDGPMQGFDEFLMSNPALEARYSALTGSFAAKMAKGGMIAKKASIKKYADGGAVTDVGGATAETDPLNKYLSTLTPNPSTSKILQTLADNPQIEQAIRNVYNVNPESMLFRGSGGDLGATINNLASEINRIGSNKALVNFYKDQQNLAGIGREDWLSNQGMGSEEWTKYQPLIRENVAKVDDTSWTEMALRTTGYGGDSRKVGALWRDPTSGAGVAVLLDTNNRPVELSFYATDGRKSTNTMPFTAEGFYEGAELNGIDFKNVGAIDNLLASKGINSTPGSIYAKSDAGINFSDIAQGGLGSAYDWTVDKNAALKYEPGTLSETIFKQQMAKRIAMAKRLGVKGAAGVSATTTPATTPTTTAATTGTTPTTTAATTGTTPTTTAATTGTTPTTTAATTGTTPTTTAATTGTTPTTTAATTGTTPTTTAATTGTTQVGGGSFTPGTGTNLGGQLSDTPTLGAFPVVTAEQTPTAGMGATAVPAATSAQQASLVQATAAAPITATPVAATTAEAATSAADVAKAMQQLTPEQAGVSPQALVTAATKEPTTTAVSGLQAAQTEAAQVTGAPTRALQAGEMVTGTTVDQARIDALMAQQQAAQGVVTPEMTVQGQLNQLLQNFDAGNPPPWAAATMRTATAQMAARGLSASSMAGQAIIQATLEAATPIAAADAKVFETMGLQNLSNRQQMAVLVAQQRAQFLGQEFDQAFQTRVLNAAKISDIANRNFDAQTQIALENARLVNSTNIANLSAKNALVLAEAAAMSQLETQNLSNLQQAAVQNAQAFLQMDMKNLDNRQQTSMFKAQAVTNALLQDASLQNAVNITNATNALEASKVSAQLKLTAETFNAAERNKVSLANTAAANELSKFNAQMQNARDEFNANMYTQVNVANAKILAEISTANTATKNATNIANAQNATQLKAAEYAQLSQTYRDLLEMSWKTGEDEKTRITEIAKATITANASSKAAAATANAAAAAKLGGAGVELIKNWSSAKAIASDVYNFFSRSDSGFTMSTLDQAYYAG